MNATLTPTKTPRIEVVDALRGFAVMAILLVHNLEHFNYPVYPTDSPAWLTAIDRWVFDATFFLFAGKAYAIFALLFGLTFFIQSHNQELVGKDFGPRFLWRLLLLAGFATVNAAFFPAGDVLLLFAVVGTVLFVARRWTDGAVLALALFFLIQPIELFHLVAALVNPAYTMPNLQVGRMYGEVGEVVRSGNFGDFILCNIGLGQKASFLWALGAGRFTQTAGLFLLGFLIGHRGLFAASSTDSGLRFWRRVLVVAMVAFVPLWMLHINVAARPVSATLKSLATMLDMWQKLAFTFVIVASFVLLYQATSLGRHCASLRLYGKMSLTNYLSQSVIGALIYFPIGLNLAPRCGYAVSLLIGVAVFALQVALCRLWLRNHRQGPLEHLWHKLTWLRK